jgi:hypothetical protein
MSVSEKTAAQASYISLAVMTEVVLTAGLFGFKSVGPNTKVTSAPWLASSSAMAMPILPLEWLPIKRTGSSGSKVGPAVTRAFWPVRGARLTVDGARCTVDGAWLTVDGCTVDEFKDFFGFGHTSVADQAAGQLAVAYRDNLNPVFLQFSNIGLRSGMVPHIHIHSWGHINWTAGGKVNGT